MSIQYLIVPKLIMVPFRVFSFQLSPNAYLTNLSIFKYFRLKAYCKVNNCSYSYIIDIS